MNAPNTQGVIIGRPTGGAVEQLGAGVGAGSRSGYARDKYPQLLEAEEKMGLATPIAGEKGAQQGRPPPSQRKTGHYGAVTATEAVSLMASRRAGVAPRIADGLDSPGRTKDGYDPRLETGDSPERPAGVPAFADTALPPAPAAETLNYVPRSEGGTITQLPQDPMALMASMVAMMKLFQPVAPAPVQPLAPPAPASQPCPAAAINDGYLTVRNMVSFGMAGGTYTIPVIDVKPGGNGIVVLLPSDGKHATFIPAPRSRFSLTFGKSNWKCYYPGTVFEFPELGVMMLVVLQDAENEQDGSGGSASG